VLQGLDGVDQLWVADKHQFDSLAGLARLPALAPLLAKLRGQRYDHLLLLHHLTTVFGTAKYAALLAAIGAGRSIGLDNGRGRFLDVRVPDSGFGDRHEVDYALEAAYAAGAVPLCEPRLEIALDGVVSPLPNGSWIGLHAGGGAYSLARRWAVDDFVEVGRRLAEIAGAQLVLIGGDADIEVHRRLSQELTGSSGQHGGLVEQQLLDLTGQSSVKETAAALAGCRLLVSNDSGVAHLAAAVGTPVVAVFGPSNDRAWGPYPPEEHRVVRASLPCSPCFYRGKRLGTPQGCPGCECLQLVSPDMVVAAALELL
jgi:ADP-heptose:LPS heptosyltransferase